MVRLVQLEISHLMLYESHLLVVIQVRLLLVRLLLLVEITRWLSGKVVSYWLEVWRDLNLG